MNPKKYQKALLWLICGVVMVAGAYIGNDFDPAVLITSALYSLLLTIGLFLSWKRKKKAIRKDYLTSCHPFIQDSFQTNPKLLHKFTDAVEAYSNRRLKDAMKLLDALRPQCTTNNERFSIACFTAFCCDEMMLYEDAIRAYQYAMQFYKPVALPANAGYCYERLKDYEQALAYYHLAMEIDPEFSRPLNNAAQIYMRTGRYQQAIECAEKAHAAESTLLPSLNALAVCHFLLGNTDSYRKYLALAQNAGGSEKNIQNYIAKLQATNKKNLL